MIKMINWLDRLLNCFTYESRVKLLPVQKIDFSKGQDQNGNACFYLHVYDIGLDTLIVNRFDGPNTLLHAGDTADLTLSIKVATTWR